MGIQINGQTDTISATDGSFTISGASGNLTGNLTGDVTGNVTGNLTGTASTATAAATAYGISGSPTLSGITSVSTSNLTVNGNAYPNAGPLSNRNLIINGSMQVAQRGTSSTSSGYQSVDRWNNQFSGGAVTQSQQSLSSGDPYNEGFRYFLRLANTTSSTDVASYREMATRIEAQNLAQSGWQYTSSASYITVSFWARSSVAQTYYLNLQSENGTKQTYPSSFALSADTWTKISKTIPGNSSITINNDNGIGMFLSIIPFYGTNYTDSGVTDNSWNARATGTQLPDMTNTWAGTTDATFDVTGVQLEVGSVATPFEHRSYGDELRRCQRYFERRNINDNGNTDGVFGIGNSLSSSNFKLLYYWNTTKRSSASISLTLDGGVIYVRDAGGNSQGTTQSFTVDAISSNHAFLTFTANGGTFTAGSVGQVRVNQSGAGNAYFSISAEL